MNCHQLIRNWQQVKGAVGEERGKLTGGNVDVSAGNRDIIPGKIPERHGIAREEAERSSKDCEASSK
ncbi:MAG: hypothetical protein ACLQVJ_08675 [Syntrophobacteraceae bacterium]